MPDMTRNERQRRRGRDQELEAVLALVDHLTAEAVSSKNRATLGKERALFGLIGVSLEALAKRLRAGDHRRFVAERRPHLVAELDVPGPDDKGGAS